MPSKRRKSSALAQSLERREGAPLSRPRSVEPMRTPDWVKGGGLTIGRISDKTGLLRVKQVGIGASQYNQYTSLMYQDGYTEEDALKAVAPDLSDEDMLFMLTGIMPDEV